MLVRVPTLCTTGAVALVLTASPPVLADEPATSPSASLVPRIGLAAGTQGPSTDGTVTVEWGPGPEKAVYEVELASPPDGRSFQPWYQGSATRSFISGLPDGTVRLRVRTVGASSWSEPLTIDVQHHSMTKAILLLLLGATVFITIAAYVVLSSREARA